MQSNNQRHTGVNRIVVAFVPEAVSDFGLTVHSISRGRMAGSMAKRWGGGYDRAILSRREMT
jgi:hypothetical protein